MEMVAKTTFEGTLLYFTNIAILLGVCSMTKTINNNNVFLCWFCYGQLTPAGAEMNFFFI